MLTRSINILNPIAPIATLQKTHIAELIPHAYILSATCYTFPIPIQSFKGHLQDVY